MGWEVSDVTADPYTSAYTTTGGTIQNAGDEYTISGNVSFIARYQTLDITLADNATNGEVLSTHDGMTAYSVTLSGRTLYKDGKWNTLCLPFALSAEQLAASPLANCELMELDTDAGSYAHITGFDDSDGMLYLNFKTATSIEAGKPYIIKWTSGSNIVGPVFNEVTINNTLTNVVSTDGTLAFVGSYSPMAFADENKSLLYLGANNTLYYPAGVMTIGSCRAYFQLNGIIVGNVSETKMFFGDADDASSIQNSKLKIQNDAVFDLSGRKFNVQSSMFNGLKSGIYIVNGRKVVY